MCSVLSLASTSGRKEKGLVAAHCQVLFRLLPSVAFCFLTDAVVRSGRPRLLLFQVEKRVDEMPPVSDLTTSHISQARVYVHQTPIVPRDIIEFA